MQLFFFRCKESLLLTLKSITQVCRYCQQKYMCSICGTSENLWICVICGNVGCGRCKDGHAIKHWEETKHCYSVELETQKVWDYAGNNHVHCLIQSETDGKLAEYYGGPGADAMCSICSVDAGMDEGLLNSTVEAVVKEYNDLVIFQLCEQRNYYEALLLKVRAWDEKEVSAAIEKAASLKLEKLQTKLDKCIEDKSFLDEINANLLNNQAMWREKIQKVQEREKAALKLKDEEIKKMQAELTYLVSQIEGGGVAAAHESMSSDIHGAPILPGPSAPSSSSGPARATRGRKKK